MTTKLQSAFLDLRVIDFIDTYTKENGFPPSISEITNHIGRSRFSTQRRLKRLIADDVLVGDPKRSRTLHVRRKWEICGEITVGTGEKCTPVPVYSEAAL
jgi:SOS-response transcriptional repressor LexA